MDTPMVTLMVKKAKPSTIMVADYEDAEEFMAFCPSCKALQTVWFNNSTLVLTRKFTQDGTRVYHDCGSMQPCHIFRSS